jgi:hypothetical protein
MDSRVKLVVQMRGVVSEIVPELFEVRLHGTGLEVDSTRTAICQPTPVQARIFFPASGSPITGSSSLPSQR